MVRKILNFQEYSIVKKENFKINLVIWQTCVEAAKGITIYVDGRVVVLCIYDESVPPSERMLKTAQFSSSSEVWTASHHDLS
jgi:hypothetical protein